MLNVDIITSLQDNYIYVINNGEQAIVIDPGEYKILPTYLKDKQVQHLDILLTHAHGDHVNGLPELLKAFPAAKVYSKAEILDQVKVNGWTIPAQQRQALTVDQAFSLQGREFLSLDTPGHCRHHLCFAVEDALFSGDLIFSVGCGRVQADGNFLDLYLSIDKVKVYAEQHRAQGKELLMFPSHEYTFSNMAFANSLGDAALGPKLEAFEVEVRDRLAKNMGNTPVDFYRELEHNPFLRTLSPIEFARIRTLKDEFAKLVAAHQNK